MAKDTDFDAGQLPLFVGLDGAAVSGSAGATPPEPPEPAGKVINFVDASTLAIRKAALRRVIQSGVFEIPS